jgi:ParB family chromosome partitioning protein
MATSIEERRAAVAAPGNRNNALADILRRRSSVPVAEREERSAAVQFSLGTLTRNPEGRLVDVPLDELLPNPAQPRFQFHRQPLEELAQSLADEGQLEPIIARRIRRDGADAFEIVAGARRLAAAKICNASIRPFPTLRADVRELTDEEAERISLIENLQRENLTPLEEGYRYWQLQQRDARKWSVRAIADFVHKKKSTVQNRLGLVRDPAVAEAVLQEQIPPTAGFHILRLPVPEREAYLRAAVARRLTVEQVRTDVERRLTLWHATATLAPAPSNTVDTAAGGGAAGTGVSAEIGDAGSLAVVVQGHLRRPRQPGAPDGAGEQRRTLELALAHVLSRIEELEAALRDEYGKRRRIERELGGLGAAG